ncbi:MAG: hypothetical protein AAF433_07330 [Bacteroidota bacterium]
MNKRTNFLLMLLAVILAFSACDDDDSTSPILLGAEITVTNTLQTAADPSMGGTGGVETPIETVFGLAPGSFRLSTAVSNGIEFPGYLDGLYDIDFFENRITYNLVAPADHPIYSNFFRTIEANTFDRYYFEFTEAHNIESGSADNSSVNFSILSDTRILIEIGEGFDFNPGSSFSISLQ